MTSWLSACFAAWCLAGAERTPDVLRIEYGQAVVQKHGHTERFVLAEYGIWLAGAVQQSRSTDAVVFGALPLQIRAWRVTLAGGGLCSTLPLPRRGTRLNFVARAVVTITERLALTYTHLSNGDLAAANPSINAFGAGVRF